MTRRHYLTLTAGGLLGSAAKINAEEAESLDGFMKKFEVPGLSFAIAREGKIIRKEALGFANLETQETLTTEHRFRIASISKPITATAIFLLIERGKLRLDDHVFGEGGLLKFPQYPGITIQHLLSHTSGGWTNDGKDPMFQNIDFNHQELIKWTLENQAPVKGAGEAYAYSNFGYCLLGRVIEKVSGLSYEDFVRENILTPCGIAEMSIGKSNKDVSYYTNGKPDRYKMNVARMDAHGGWVGTPGELLNFVMRVDGFPEPADLLKQDSINQMTTPGTVNPSYACGWNINEYGNYWHSGSLPGLTSLLVRTRGGYCWAACINTRKDNLGLALDRLMWKLARS